MPRIQSSSLHASSRRRFLSAMAAGGAFWTVPGAFAAALQSTPAQTEGPFYPDRLPLDTDNDLIVLNDATTPALGTVTYLSGRVMDVRDRPIRNAVVEIWQADHHGVYLHRGSAGAERRDQHFQGYGRFLTGSNGEYLFRTIKPVAYPGRTPHIHVAVKSPGREKLTTQCYIRGEKGNGTDGVLKGIRDERARNSVIVAFDPLKGSQAGELAARFDLVLGLTPES